MEFIKNALGFGRERPIYTTADGKIWLDILAHVQDIGDVKVQEGKHQVIFPGKRIEGFEISYTIPDVEIKYMAHLENKGDTAWISHGNFIGSRGQSRRLEGFAVKLEGKGASAYDVKYYVQMHGIEASPIAKNGQFAGTRGQSRRVEGFAIWLEPKQELGQGETAQEPEVSPYAEFNSGPAGLVGEVTDIDAQYKFQCSTPSDIYEHLPTLYKYSLGCTDIAEFGVRSVVSTWAFLKGLKDTDAPRKKLLCVDLERSSNVNDAQAAAAKSNIEFEFITDNDLKVDLKDGVDLLFIDTWHVYPQLKRELELHSSKVRKYIAMHDTTVDAELGESVRSGCNIAQQAKESGFSEADIRTGLRKALKEFLETHKEWRSKEVYTNCNGLTILERVETPDSS